MEACIISIGDELLIGQVVNTNATFIAEELNLCGIRVSRIITTGDSAADITSALDSAASVAGIIIATGGLGPTSDDITKETLCRYFGTRLVMHPDTLENIRALFYQNRLEVSERNRNQAMVPENCDVLPNSQGTAPGMWFTRQNKDYIFLPGVPFEMKQIFSGHVLPGLIKKYPAPKIIHRSVLTMGTGESSLADRIQVWEAGLPPEIRLAYLPQPGIIRLRLSVYETDGDNPLELIELQIEKLRKLIPGLIFGYDNDSLPELCGAALLKKAARVSTAESCTGGSIAQLITSVPGSSEWYAGSVVAYSNEAKISMLGVDPELINRHGAVSREVVCAMAEGIRRKLGTEYSIAASGIAGPGGGTPEKPVGTVWIAVSDITGTEACVFLLGNNRERNIRRASLFALNMMRIRLGP